VSRVSRVCRVCRVCVIIKDLVHALYAQLMNALSHTQLHKKVAVNERDMFEWHYLLEGPDGFSLSLAQTHSLYILCTCTYTLPI